MDELTVVSEFLSEERPASARTIAEARRRLTGEAAKRRRRPSLRDKPSLRIAVIALATGGVAAAAVAVGIGTGGSGGSGGRSVPPARAVLSGQQILLAAAATAERMPDGSGTYWHVKTVTRLKTSHPDQWERWTRRDGQTWFRGEKTNGKVVKIMTPGRPGSPFMLGEVGVNFAQLRNLPATPNALKAWIAGAVKNGVKNGDIRTSAGRPDASEQNRFVYEGLTSLLSDLPASPKVRAAAFRAIASYPNIKSLGAVDGGQALMTPEGKLVVDPVTSRVRATDGLVSGEIVAEWTNQLPK